MREIKTFHDSDSSKWANENKMTFGVTYLWRIFKIFSTKSLEIFSRLAVGAEMVAWEMVDRGGVWCCAADTRSVIDAFGDQRRGVLCVQYAWSAPAGMLSM